MNKIILSLTAALVFPCVAGAQKYIGSPAQDLYDQASFFLETQYFGPSTIVMADHIAKYQAAVDEACAATGLQCNSEKIEPLLDTMFDDINDPHAYYLSAAAVRQENANRTGTATSPVPRVGFTSLTFCETPDGVCTFDSTGNLTSKLNGDRLITGVVKNAPADKVGLKYGDRWIGYNGMLYSSLNGDVAALNKFQADFTTKVRASETVTMMILRGADKQKLDIAVKGELINTSEIPQLELRADGIGILRVPDYLIAGIGQRIHDLIRDATPKGLKGIIFNQRGNGGGSALERWFTTGAFIKTPDPMRRTPRYNADKNTVEEGFVNGAFYQRYVSRPEIGNTLPVKTPVLFEGPMAVLVDTGCASACEYISSSFQRAKRASVIGEPTVGIGNTNTARFGLANGGAAGMPTLRTFWSDGVSLPAQIKPDVTATVFNVFKTGVDEGMNKALEAVGVKTLQVPSSSIEINTPFAPIPTFGYDAIQAVLEKSYTSTKTLAFEAQSSN
jgi:carboxyl-terminal processing protease